jgi:sarcosine oxidase subunit beta
MAGKAYDVIIIGAGSVGVPAAWAMARSGLRVMVLDRSASPGQGSNKAAIGGIRATHSEPAKIRICLRSLELAASWEETYGDPIEWRTGGYSFVAYDKREAVILKDLIEVQQASGLDIAWHDAAELIERIPALNPDGLLGGTLSPGDGHCSPLLLGHAIYRQAKHEGAEFRFRETVTGIRADGGRILGVTTDRGTYAAPILLNAAGAWAADVGRGLGFDHPVVPDSHEAGITEPVARFLDPMIVDIKPGTASANCYFFQLETGQVLFSLTPRPSIPGTDCQETSGFLPQIARRMIRLVPKLANIRVRRTWRGLYPMTPDGAPLVGWSSDIEGYLMAIGMCGHGFMLGPGLGEVLDRLARGASTTDDDIILSGLSPHRSFDAQAALK